jgi:hypothetical protein
MTLQHHVKLKLLILICQSLISYSIKTAPFFILFKKVQYTCIHAMNIHNTDTIDSSYFSIPERTKIYRIGYLYWIRNCLHFWNKWPHPCFQWGSFCPILNFLFSVFVDLCVFELFALTIVLSVLWFTSSDYPVGIFWSLHCLFFDLRLLITPLVSFGHCIVCSLIYVFWLPLWYLLVIVLSVLWFTSSDYPFGIFWSLYCLFFDLPLLIIPLVSFGHCIICSLIYVF